MLAWFSDDVSVALIAAIASVAAAAIGIVGVVIATGSKRIAASNERRLDTGNGHTIGQSAARQEDMLSSLLNRTDRMEVRLDEHIETSTRLIHENRPIRDWVVEQMERRPEAD